MLATITTRRGALRLALAGAALPLAGGVNDRAHATALPPVAVWKDASCGCCGGWVRHMRDAGFTVTVHDTADMTAVKQARGVPESLWSCHTAVVGGYLIEGHVPAADIQRLLGERTIAKGLAAPGMPRSAPGMDDPGEPYTVVLFGTQTGDRSYAQH